MYFRYWIRKFGRALNFDTGTHEKFHQEVVVKPFKADARREEGQLDRLYVATNMSQCLHTFLRNISSPPELKATGFTLKDTYSYSFKQLLLESIKDMKVRKATEKDAQESEGNSTNIFHSTREINVIKAVVQRGLTGVPTELHLLEVGKKLVQQYGEETVNYISSVNYLQKGERYRVCLKCILKRA